MSIESNQATLLVSCPDRKGLVAALASLLSDHGANILDAQQHAEPQHSMFFQRICFDMTDLDITRQQLEDLLAIECGRYDMDWRISYGDQRKKIAIFVSKFEHCIYDLLLRHRLGELNSDISMVISNHEDLRPLADGFGVPFHYFPINKDNKTEQEAAEIALMKEQGVDLIVLARYMQILSGDMIRTFPMRIINIHHSTLPAFVGARPYHQAFERGVKLIGATAHYATEDLDQGPIIAQGVEECSHVDTVDDLIRTGRDIERMTLAKAVRAHLEDRILTCGRRTVVF